MRVGFPTLIKEDAVSLFDYSKKIINNNIEWKQMIWNDKKDINDIEWKLKIKKMANKVKIDIKFEKLDVFSHK